MNHNIFENYSGQKQGRDNHCSGFALGAILSCMNYSIISGHDVYSLLSKASPDPQHLIHSYSFWNATGNLHTSSMQKIEGKMVLPSSLITKLPILLPIKYQFTIYCNMEKWELSLSRFTSDYNIDVSVRDFIKEQMIEIQKCISPKLVEPLDKLSEAKYEYAMILISDGVHWVSQANNGNGYNPSWGITDCANWECSGLAISFGQK